MTRGYLSFLASICASRWLEPHAEYGNIYSFRQESVSAVENLDFVEVRSNLHCRINKQLFLSLLSFCFSTLVKNSKDRD